MAKTTAKSKKKPAAKGKKAKAAKPGEFRSVKGEVVDADSSSPQSLEAGVDIVAPLPAELPEEATGSSLATADPLTRYLSEIRKYPLLTREQEHDLAVRFRDKGDAKAAEALVTANLRFVVKVAAEYSKFGARLIDLVQEGNVGLMHAVKEFNPYKGTRLITYAVWWIRGYIQEYLMRQYSMVRIGTTATQKKLFYQLQREKQHLEKMGIEQGIAQLSGRLGVSEQEVQDMQQRLSSRDVSLDAPVKEEGEGRWMDLQTEVDPVQLDEQLGTREQLKLLHEKIDEIRPQLNEREQYLLEARLLSDEPLTLQEIGDKYGITREAVRQMETRLMQKLRSGFIED